MTAVAHPVPAAPSRRGPGGAAAAAGDQAQRGAVGAAAAGGGVLLRHVPHRRRVPARLDRCARRRSPTTCCSSSARSPAGWPPGWVRARAAGRPSTWSRPRPARRGRGRASRWAATLGWLLLAFLAGVAALYIADRAAGDLGRAAAVAGLRRRGRRDRGDRHRVRLRRAFPRPVHRAAGRDRRARPRPARGSTHALNVTASSGTYALLSPATSPPRSTPASSTMSLPDVPIAQVMFMGGITVALLGVLSLAPVLRKLGQQRLAGARHAGGR